MLAQFIKLTVFFMVLFGNEVVFGMMISNNRFVQMAKEKQKKIEKEIEKQKKIEKEIKKEIKSSFDGNEWLNTKLILNKDVTKYIFSQCLFLDQLNIRRACKYFKRLCEGTILNGSSFGIIFNQKIFPVYQNNIHKISSSCAFLDCVQKRKYPEVEWFLKSGMNRPLYAIKYVEKELYLYYYIDPTALIQPNDVAMEKLFEKYDQKNFFNRIINAHEYYCTPLYFKKLLEWWEGMNDSLTTEGKQIDLNSPDICKRMSEKEYNKRYVVRYNKDYNKLIMLACIRDIEAFDQELTDTKQDYYHLILILQIALKNKDFKFIEYLLRNKRIISMSCEVLPSLLLKTPVENSDELIISQNEYFDDRLIVLIKNFISNNVFDEIPKLIENNKNNNKYIKEIFDLLNEKIFLYRLNRMFSESKSIV